MKKIRKGTQSEDAAKVTALVTKLNRYRHEYYNLAAPSVPDAVYDHLFDELQELEKQTGIILSNFPTQTVGAVPVSSLKKVKHPIPLLSLDKTKQMEELLEMAGRSDSLLMLKLDGLTVADFDISGFKRWKTVRGNVYPKLINAEQNKELLEKIPHRNFMDLAVVYYTVARDHARVDIGTILIYNGHMEMWGQEEENLYQTAMMNMRADGEADLATIETIVKRIVPDFIFPAASDNAPRNTSMYILTNRSKRFGAAEILDKRTLRMIADKVGDRFIILPSSVHETIVLPPKDETEYEWLAGMVREVNDIQVDIEERLSYHVYMYSRGEETLKIVA